MKIILMEDVDSLGRSGDIVVVKEGYARNYLIPRNKARPATPANVRMAEAMKKKREAQELKKKAETLKVADEISKASCTINMAAGEEDKLYGSVTSEMISEALSEKGFKVDKKDIVLEEPIKKLGLYQVEVKLSPQATAVLKVWVVKE